MPEIQIQINEKIARVIGTPSIVCGNSDYIIQFSFDSEWDVYTVKTARFVYYKCGTVFHQDIVFAGDICSMPALYETDCIAVGVYAGDIHTSTPARIPCAQCITDGASVHPDPPPDVYAQILEYLADIEANGIIIGSAELLTNGIDLFIAGIADEWEGV